MNSIHTEADPPAVVSIPCERHEGGHKIYPLALSLDNLKKLWEIGKQYRTIFGHEFGDDFWKFVSFFVTLSEGEQAKANGLFWIVDDFAGMLYLTDIDPPIDTSVHFAFYKSLGSCKIPIMLEGLNYCFQKYNFHRLSTEVPLFATKYTFEKVKALGFRYEGRKLESRLFDGKLFHVDFYGLLQKSFYETFAKRKEVG